MLDVFSAVVQQSEILKDSVVVLDGFTGFTPVQNRVLGQLLKICRKVTVTVTIDQREDPYQLKHKYQLFTLSKQMVTGLVHIAAEENIEVEPPVQLYGTGEKFLLDSGKIRRLLFRAELVPLYEAGV